MGASVRKKKEVVADRLPADVIADTGKKLRTLRMKSAAEVWDEIEMKGRKEGNLLGAVRILCQADLFYMLVRACKRQDLYHPWFYARCREVETSPNGHIDLWAREHGKDLADDTPMLTANRGWTTHGQLEVGDVVFAPSGKQVRVLALSERYTTSKCYRVTFHDGAEIVAGAGHFWKLRVKHKHRVANSDLREIRFTEEVVTTEQLSGDYRCDVGVAAALEMPVAQNLEIDPYVLGAWLGDGTATKPVITCADADRELIERIRSKGCVVVELPYGRQRNCSNYAIDPGIKGKRGTGMGGVLRRMGLWKNKHIPEKYMRASIHQRTELLRGLMDTDGYCNDRGTADFVNTNERLARQVFELAAGLGLRPRFAYYEKMYEGEPYPVWRVSFQAHKDRNPFALKRKADRAIDKYLHRDTRLVSKIEQIESVPTRCIQVEGGMYLAGKELIPTHNSSIITFGLTIQDILKDPEVTVGIFSHTRPISKAFLRLIMRELETNATLKAAFPDILWEDTRQAPKWSEDDGIIVKRKSNPNEATVEAWGLVDGQPVSKHFRVLLYDDVVVQASVTTPEMIEKTMTRLEESYNLGKLGGCRRFAGTRWHHADAYGTIIKRGTAIPRIYPGREGGTEDGKSVYWPEEVHFEKRRDMGPYSYSSQILMNPAADTAQGFRREWLRHYKRVSNSDKLNRYLLVDAASSKKKGSDYSAMMVVGLGPDGNYYVLDMVRDRLNLAERCQRVFDLHRKWKPREVRYERYGMMADIEALQGKMEQENYRFQIREVAGQTSKIDRIKRLLPLFEQGKIWLPETLHVTNWERVPVNLVQTFVEEEYVAFPHALHDDQLDALSRICEPDLKIVFPKEERAPAPPPRRNIPQAVGWMA